MKKELRKIYLEKRKHIEYREIKDESIIVNLHNVIKNYNNIMIYYPISSEPNILNIIKLNENKKFYLPFCNKGDIEVRLLQDLNDLIKDDTNIFSSKIKTNDKVEVVVSPAVACNSKFYRLGYGGGYYDRFLKDQDVVKIIIAYDDLIINEQYQEDFDIQYDYIITESKILKME